SQDFFTAHAVWCGAAEQPIFRSLLKNKSTKCPGLYSTQFEPGIFAPLEDAYRHIHMADKDSQPETALIRVTDRRKIKTGGGNLAQLLCGHDYLRHNSVRRRHYFDAQHAICQRKIDNGRQENALEVGPPRRERVIEKRHVLHVPTGLQEEALKPFGKDKTIIFQLLKCGGNVIGRIMSVL